MALPRNVLAPVVEGFGNGSLTRSALTVTDGAEVSIVALTDCGAVYVDESPAASGWPRNFMVRAAVSGSQQQTKLKASTYKFIGPFQVGDSVGTLELVSNSGDTSTFNVLEARR